MDVEQLGGYEKNMVRFYPNCSIVLLAGLLLTASPLLSPAVLCVGMDGHVAIEANVAGFLCDCDDSHRHSGQTEESNLSRHMDGTDHCGTCNDYAISQDSRHQSWDVSDLLNLLSHQSVAAITANSNEILIDARAVEPFISLAPPIESKTLTSLSTVIIIS